MIAIWGISDNSSIAASIPIILGGLCKGARPASSLKVFKTSRLITTDLENFSPPWTTLCPIAAISDKSSIGPYSEWTRQSLINFIASL